MEIEPLCNGEKFIPTTMVSPDLICVHSVISGVDATLFLSFFRNFLASLDKTVIARLEKNGKYYV